MGDILISAIIMAMISSLGFIAYKHPKGYARMYWPLSLTVLGGFVLWGAYQIGYTSGFSDSSIGYLTLNPGVLLHDPKAHQVPFWAWMLPSLFMFYLVFLKNLSHILDLHSEDNKEDEPKHKVNDEDPKHDAQQGAPPDGLRPRRGPVLHGEARKKRKM